MPSVIKEKVLNIVRALLVIIIVLVGAINIIMSFPYRLRLPAPINEMYVRLISLHHTVSTILGIVLIFTGHRLYKRMRMAWLMVTIAMPVLIVIGSIRIHSYGLLIIEIIIFTALLLDYKHYNRQSDPISLKNGLLTASISIILVLLNTAAGFLVLRRHFINIHDFLSALSKSFELLFLMDKSVVQIVGRLGNIFVDSVITLNWFVIILSLLLILKPLIYQPIVSAMDIARVRDLANRFGSNPITYLAVEEDKKYFFSKLTEGVIAYTVANGVAVCVSEPICDAKDGTILISEFMNFCRENNLSICFCQASDKFWPEFESLGFGRVKYGDEAMFRLSEYNLAGKKAAKVRYAVNHADKIGIRVEEYKPAEKRDWHKENEIRSVSREWLGMKKSSEMSFMLGSVGLENPMDKRYFLGYDTEGKLQGFVVFTPFLNKKGYHADVTRRKPDAPVGVMEMITVSAFNTMKDEGVEWGSLGLAPLSNMIDEENKANTSERFLGFIYEHMNRFYGFKTLYHYKKNYGPTDWVTRYLVYYPNAFNLKIAYSIVKAQNPKGIKGFIFKKE
jgi:Uncharacterized conserved protein